MRRKRLDPEALIRHKEAALWDRVDAVTRLQELIPQIKPRWRSDFEHVLLNQQGYAAKELIWWIRKAQQVINWRDTVCTEEEAAKHKADLFGP